MKKAFTLMELLVVVLILGLLATIAVGVYTTQVERARYAAARTTINAIELACNRYQLDVGEFPPSGSEITAGTTTFEGNGWMYLALTRSLSGNTSSPASVRWQGPYIDVKKMHLGDISGNSFDDPSTSMTVTMAGVQILDPWGSPYRYVRCCGSPADNYTVNNATKLPADNPYAATDVYYNPATFQVVSNGRNGVTNSSPNLIGTQEDDVNNFGF